MLPPVPAFAWIVCAFGIAIVLILIVIFTANLLAPISWALFIVAAGFGIAVLCPMYKKIILFIKRH